MKLKMISTVIKLSFGAILAMTIHMPASFAAIPGTATACDAAHPIIEVTSEGSGQNVPTNLTLKVTFIGPITNAKKLARGGKQNIQACEGALIDYRAESTIGAATCTINKRPIPPQGQIKATAGAQRLVCTNKPEGGDTDQFLIVGVGR